MRPAKGSASVLKTKRESGWPSSYLRSRRSPLPSGSLKPTWACSSGCGNASARKVSRLAVHPGENESAGNVILGAIVPNFFSGHLRADVCVNGDEGGISGDERGFRFGDESGIAWEVDQINLDFLGRTGGSRRGGRPFGMGETGLNGDFSGDFFFVPVGGGGAFSNFSPTRSHARGEE